MDFSSDEEYRDITARAEECVLGNDWLSQNILKPTANAALIEPYNALADTANKVSSKTVGCSVTALKEHYEIKPAALFSTEWYAQTISGGAGAALPYAAAGLFCRGALLKTGEKIGAKSFTGQVFASQHTANIVGAGTYDLLRVTRENETKAGNVLGGLAGFSLFEAGNYATNGLTFPKRILARSMTGVLGGNAQLILSRQIATGKNPSAEELLHSAAGGAVLNNVLPGLQRMTLNALIRSQLGAGRPVNVSDYVNQRFAGQEITSLLHNQIQENPLARVQEKAGINAAIHKQNLVLLDSNNSQRSGQEAIKQAKLGHELDHLATASSETARAGYKAIAELLSQGKQEEAWLQFRQLRLAQEQSAVLTESSISTQLFPKDKLVGLPTAGKSLLPHEKPQNTLSYEQIWRTEFEQFAASEGKVLPAMDHALAQQAGTNWNERLARYHEFSSEEKLEILKESKQAPESLQNSLWSRLVKDPDQQVRIATIAQIDTAPLPLRQDLFYAAIHSPDYFTRTAGIAKLSCLPAASREKAFLHVLTQQSVLTDTNRTIDRYSGQLAKPATPEWLNEKQNKPLKQLLDLPPEKQLVKELGNLPAVKRWELWSRMLEDRRQHVRLAAASNIEPLAPVNRLTAWTKALEYRNALNTGRHSVLETLAEQLRHLNIDDRERAWTDLTDPATLKTGSSARVAKGLEYLPESMRLAAWHDLYRTMDNNQIRSRWDPHSLTQDRHGLIAAISHLEPEARLKTLKSVAQEFDRSHLADLFDVIRSLPEENRMEALLFLGSDYINQNGHETQVRTSGQSTSDFYLKHRLEMAVASQPAKNIPDALAFLAQCKDAELKTDLLESLPIQKLNKLPADERLNILAETFTKAAELNDPEISQGLKSWFDYFEQANHFDDPELSVTTPYDTARIKQHLIDTISGDKLAQIFLLTNDKQAASRFAYIAPEVLHDFILNSKASSSPEGENLAGIADAWINSSSLQEATGFAIKHSKMGESDYTIDMAAPELLAALAKHSPLHEQRAMLQDLASLITDKRHTPNPMQVQLAIETAVQLKNIRQDQLVNELFFKPVQEAISDTGNSYPWRLDIARHIASLQREGKIEANEFQMPNLRMPEVEGLTALERDSYRYKAEAALTSPHTLRKMLNEGMLGQLFPDVFGHASRGGIFERPQHSGHDFILHEHILNVVQRVQEHPEFKLLSDKDQVNILWAALLHDVGKQPGTYDPHHEWASANMAWGVLGTLGYPPERIQRIASLISRHSEVSFNPGERVSQRLQSKDFAEDLSVHYRHPNAVRQLAILNEADIKSIASDSRHWTTEVSLELQTIRQMLSTRIDSLNSTSMPLLTSALPKEFGLFKFKDDYAVLAHTSSTISNGTFLKQLSLIESPQYSISTSLLTPSHQHTYGNTHGLLALIKGPYENISQADRSNLGTGTAVDWQNHVRLATEWKERNRGQEFIREIDEKIAQVNRHLTTEKLYRQLAEFDNLDELQQQTGEHKPLLKAHQAIVEALTTDNKGLPSVSHNEVKLNNPTLAGFGILRRGNPVAFQDMPAAMLSAHVLRGQTAPPWLSTGSKATQNTVSIPAPVWQEAMRRRLPFMILDP